VKQRGKHSVDAVSLRIGQVCQALQGQGLPRRVWRVPRVPLQRLLPVHRRGNPQLARLQPWGTPPVDRAAGRL